jgi:site-specific recombinase XerD
MPEKPEPMGSFAPGALRRRAALPELTPAQTAELARLEALRREMILRLLLTKSANTLRAYNSDLADFQAFCRAHDLVALPASPQTLAQYVLSLLDRGLKASTILRRRASILAAHELFAGPPSDATEVPMRALLGNLRRQVALSPKKAAITTDVLRQLLAATPRKGMTGARDRALLLVGFAGGFTAGELVTLAVEDVAVTDHRLRIRLRPPTARPWQSRMPIEIPRGTHPETCPIQALRVWYAISGVAGGAVFRSVDRHGRIGLRRLSERAVGLIIKRAARRADLDDRLYSAHSLRVGMVTAAIAGGAPERVIVEQTGHRTLATLRRYPGLWSYHDRRAADYLGL